MTKLHLELTPKVVSGSAFYQYMATLSGSVVIVATGMLFGWTSPTLPILLSPDSPVPITNADGSWLAVMPCIGAIVGCFAALTFVDKIGRKPSMLLVSPLYFIAWMLKAFSGSVWLYHLARFISGVSDGIAFTTYPMYLGEIADFRIRGLLCSSIPVMTIAGFMMINIVGAYMDIKTTALVSSSLPVIHFVTFFFMPESPYFLLMRKRYEDAKKELQKLRGLEDVDEELKRLSQAVELESQKGCIWDLFTVKSNRRAVYVVMGIRAVQQFSGTTAITFYTKTIFEAAGSSLAASTATIIYFAIQLAMAVVCSVLVDKVGRRPLLIFSVIGSGVTLFVEGLYFYYKNSTTYDVSNLHALPIIALLAYNVIFSVGMGTIPVAMLGELFPTNVKAFALCLADIYFGIMVIVVSKFFQIMKDDFGMHVPFFAFTVCCVIGLVFIVMFVPETKGKTLEEIQDLFKGNVSKSIEDDTAAQKSGNINIVFDDRYIMKPFS